MFTYHRLPLSLPANLNVDIKYYPKKIAVISCHFTDSYYHWLLQALSKIIVLHYSGITYDNLHVFCEGYNWQLDSLKIICNFYKIDYNKVIVEKSNRKRALQADKLIVPSLSFFWNYYYMSDKDPALYQESRCPQWLLNELRAIFLDNPVNKTSLDASYKKIYISRAKAGRRRIINENELIQELEKRGFKILYLEDFSVFDQAQIFNQARVIVGAHGAGFTNVVFSNPDYVLIELEHFLLKVRQRQFFVELVKFTSGTHYQYYVDKVLRKDKNKDMIVPVESFIPFLDDVLEHYKP